MANPSKAKGTSRPKKALRRGRMSEAARCANTERPLTHHSPTREGGLAVQATQCAQCGSDNPVIDGRSWRRRTCSLECHNAARRARHTTAAPKPLRPLADRLWARTLPTANGCWEWQGYRGPRGYGQIGRGRGADGITSTHRAAWEVTHGPIPAGAVVRHTCDNPPCCNPAHLILGTHADNSRDKVERNRQAKATGLPQTRLSDDDVRAIRARYLRATGPTKRGGRSSNASELAAEFGISRMYVMQIVARTYRADVS